MNLIKLGLLAAGGSLGVGCAKREGMRRPTTGGIAQKQQGEETLGRAELRPVGDSNARGTVVVREQEDGKLHLKGRIRGLEPNSSHTVLLNPAGECASAPTGEQLAFLGTVTADANGVASLSVTKDGVAMPAEVIGSSLIVRESSTMGGGNNETEDTEPMIENRRGGLDDEPGMGEEPSTRPEPGMGEPSDQPTPSPDIDNEPMGGPDEDMGTPGEPPARPGEPTPRTTQPQSSGGFDTGELEQSPGQPQRQMEACAVIVPESQGG
jgi:hypothetical protein